MMFVRKTMAALLAVTGLSAALHAALPIPLAPDAKAEAAGIGRWKKSDAVFAVMEVLPGGKIHLKDTHTGKTNETLRLMFTDRELQEVRGRKIRFSAKIQLIAGTCSIGYWGQTRNRRFFDSRICKGKPFDTPVLYAVELEVPEDANALIFNISCAGGFGNTGEAIFSELKIELVSAPEPAKEKGGQEPKECSRFWLFRDAVLPQYVWNPAGSPMAAEIVTPGFRGGNGFRVIARENCTPRHRIFYETIAHNRGYDFRDFEQANGWIEFYFRPAVRIAVSWHEPRPEQLAPAADGWTRCRIPLKEMRDKINWKKFHILTFSFPGGAKKGQIVEFDQLAVVAPGKIPPPKTIFHDAKSEADFTKSTASLKTPLPKKIASRQMPELRNGTYYKDGQPVFLQGPFLDNLTLSRDFMPHAKRTVVEKYPHYWSLFDADSAAKLGFSSLQLSAASFLPMEQKLGLPIRESPRSQLMEEPFYRSLKGMPAVLDFAWIYIPGVVMKDDRSLPAEVFQQNSNWHMFMPFCPEHPEGKRMMHEYFRSGTAMMLRRGLNPYCYELFNEVSFNCQCRYNRAAFAKILAGEYGTIEAANRAWKTSFASFDAAASIPNFGKIPALWVRWCKFSGDRYVSLFKEYKEIVRSEDPSPKILFGEQRGSALAGREVGKDYYKLAQELDVLATESGYKFGAPSVVHRGKEAEEAADASGYRYALETDTLAALVKGKNKALANHEHYCMRMSGDTRVPTRRNDITTALWMEIFHDVSASYFFNWGSNAPRWKTLEDAKKLVIHGGANSSYLLNPYAYPPESLNGFSDFRKELEPLRTLALPMPRRKTPSVALLHSTPSLRLSVLPPQSDYAGSMLSYYAALTTLHYPFEILFEEDAVPKNLAQYQIVIAPELRNSYQKTVPALLDYVEKGGMLFLGRPDGGNFDEENKPLKTKLPAMRKSGEQEQCTLGKGRIFRLVKNAANPKPVLKRLMAENRIVRHASAEAMDGGTVLDNTEIRIIDRKDAKLICLVNWNDEAAARLVRFRLFDRSRGRWQLIDPLEKVRIVRDGKGPADWSPEELAKGIPVILKSQCRKILLAVRGNSPVKPEKDLSISGIHGQFKKIRQEEQTEILHRKARLEAEKKTYADARIYRGVDPKKCETVDLRKFVNTGFQDDYAGDGKGGWFDQGFNDFRRIKTGRNVHAGVPFDVINPADNHGRGVLILRGAGKKQFPASAQNIPAGGKAKAFYLLHTAGWNQPQGTPVYLLKLHYTDGSSATLELNYEVEIGDWWRPGAFRGAKIAMEARNPQCERIGFYVCRKINPHPEKTLRALDLISADAGAVPAIAAITIERP